MKRLTMVVVLALVATALSGCISYRLDRLPQAPPLQAVPLDDNRPTLVYSINSLAGTDLTHASGGSGGFPEIDLTTPADELAATLQRSGWFRSLQKTGDDRTGDMQLDAVISVSGNDVVVLASMCTFTLIPMWRTVTWDLTAEARDRDGRLHRYAFQDEARDIFWLPIVLGMSFRPWGEAYGEVRANLYRTLLIRMRDDGLFAPASP